MQKNEITLILIESLIHTENTKVDYFFNKAKEMGVKPTNLYLDLSKSYDELVKYVNSIKDYYTWTEDNKGNKRYFKNVLNLDHFTKGRMQGNIDDKNVTELLPALHKFGKLLQYKNLQKIENIKPSNVPNIKGFQSSLKPTQIKRLFEQLKVKLIDEKTNFEHFEAIFKDNSLPKGFVPIKKLKLFTNVLLAYFVNELFQKENPNNYWSVAENCFEAKNLKQSFNNAYQFNPDQKPKGYEEIDKILKNIYSPLQ